MQNYELGADEVILYEGMVRNTQVKDPVQITLTSKRIIFEQEVGFFKKEKKLIDIISIKSIKVYNNEVQITQNNEEVTIQSTEKNIKDATTILNEAKSEVTIKSLDTFILNGMYLVVTDGKLYFEKILLDVDRFNFELAKTYSLKANIKAKTATIFNSIEDFNNYIEKHSLGVTSENLADDSDITINKDTSGNYIVKVKTQIISADNINTTISSEEPEMTITQNQFNNLV